MSHKVKTDGVNGIVFDTIGDENVNKLENIDLNRLHENILVWGYMKGIVKFENRFQQFTKLGEECGELAHGLCRDDKEVIKDSIGDAFVVLTLLAAQNGLTINECVEVAYNEIKNRTGKMKDGVFVKD
jgi:NTP pyrophosphatase (non-canonical NTP hydrolase)